MSGVVRMPKEGSQSAAGLCITQSPSLSSPTPPLSLMSSAALDEL